MARLKDGPIVPPQWEPEEKGRYQTVQGTIVPVHLVVPGRGQTISKYYELAVGATDTITLIGTGPDALVSSVDQAVAIVRLDHVVVQTADPDGQGAWYYSIMIPPSWGASSALTRGGFAWSSVDSGVPYPSESRWTRFRSVLGEHVWPRGSVVRLHISNDATSTTMCSGYLQGYVWTLPPDTCPLIFSPRGDW